MANEFKIKNGLIVSGSAEIEQDLTVRGTITADEYHVSVTSSSIFYESGSNIFGNSADDNHVFTGSVFLTGSFNYIGPQTITGSQYISGSISLYPTLDPDISGTTTTATHLFVSSSNNQTGQDLYIRQEDNKVKWKWFEGKLNSGILWGGALSYSGSTIYITPGSGIVIDQRASATSEISPITHYVNWNAITASCQNLTSSLATYVGIDMSGSLYQQNNYFSVNQYRETIPLGMFNHTNKSSITSYANDVLTAYDDVNQTANFIQAFGPLKLEGLSIIPQSGTTQLTVGSGQSYIYGGFYQLDPNNSSHKITAPVVTPQIARVRRDGNGSYTVDNNNGAFYTTLDTTKWDDGTGTLNSLGGNYAIQRVFFNPFTTRVHVYFGQAYYGTKTAAFQSLSSDPFSEAPYSAHQYVLLGYIIHKGGASDLSDPNDAKIIQAGLFRNTVGSGGNVGTFASLHDLDDVDILNPNNGDLIRYNSTTNLWEHSKQLTGDYQITGSLMVSGSLNVSGSIVPAVNNQYDLGSPTHQFKDLYLSSASLYIDGTKVLGSTAQELQITTDTGQSFKILEDGSDNITLQSVDGNIELKSSGGGDVIMDPTTGVIALKGTTTLYAGNKLLSSDGNAIQVGNSLTVTGSMIVTDYIETQELRTTYISSSILYRSGSTKFGDELGDTHSFTGSLLLSGSLSTTNNITISNSYRPYFIANTSNSGEEAGIKIQQGTVSDWYFGTAQGTVSANDLAIRDVKNNRIPFYLSSSTGDAVFRKVNIQSPTVGSEVVLNVQNGANANGQHTLIKTGNGNKSLYTGVYLNDADVGYISMNSSPSNSIGIYINESGHTGFGVLNPGYNVHVVKDGSAGTNSNIVGASIVSSRTSGQSENIAIRHTSSTIGLNGNEHAGQIVSHGNNSFEIYSTGAAAIILGTNATARIKIDSSGIYPFLNNTYNLGTATYGWANLYTNDLHLSNMNKPEGNDIDGTSGNWTIQEGDKNLYIINNNTNEKFKIVLQKI